MTKLTLTTTQDRVIKNLEFLVVALHCSSQTVFSKNIDVAFNSVNNWFRRYAFPTTEHLKKISHKSRISIDNLVRKDISKIPLPKLRANFNQVQIWLNEK